MNTMLPIVSKILKRIMYNFFTNTSQRKILCPKQFDFQAGHSTDNPIIQIFNGILGAFENDLHTLGGLVDLCYWVDLLAFATVDNTIMLKKLNGIYHMVQVVTMTL